MNGDLLANTLDLAKPCGNRNMLPAHESISKKGCRIHGTEDNCGSRVGGGREGWC